jgi:SRSO17 transposase
MSESTLSSTRAASTSWDYQEMLEQVLQQVLPAMQKHGPVVAWIIDDTGFPKQGKHSVGVARQSSGQLGKSDNWQEGSVYSGRGRSGMAGPDVPR